VLILWAWEEHQRSRVERDQISTLKQQWYQEHQMRQDYLTQVLGERVV
jgi:hypothetical protein